MPKKKNPFFNALGRPLGRRGRDRLGREPTGTNWRRVFRRGQDTITPESYGYHSNPNTGEYAKGKAGDEGRKLMERTERNNRELPEGRKARKRKYTDV